MAISQQRQHRKRYRILLSSFSQEEKATLKNIIRYLGGIYLETPNFVDSCTHIICEKPNRGEKFLCGCAMGKWILKKEFLLDSQKKGFWLEESNYEWDSNKGYENIPLSHVLAPRRWRQLQNDSSQEVRPFAQWKAVVVLSDATRQQGYKRLLESGGGSVVNLKLPYDSEGLAPKLTHVFTEKNLEASVAGLRKAGVPCLSPDFIPELILRNPQPQASEFDLKSYNPRTTINDIKNPYVAKSLGGKMTTRGRKDKENLQNTNCSTLSRKNQQSYLSTAPKRKASFSSSLLPQSKKSKKGAQRSSEFGNYIQNVVKCNMEESLVNKALSAMHSFLSSARFPPADIVHAIMRDILLNSSSTEISYRAYRLLQRLLLLHPPSLNRDLYETALRSCQQNSVADTQIIGTIWEFVRQPIRLLVGLESTENIAQMAAEREEGIKVESSLLLLKFLVLVLEKDYSAFISPDSGESFPKVRPLVSVMLWPNGCGVGTNCEVRELIELICMAIKTAQKINNDVELVQLLQSLLAMAAQCCRDTDKSPGHSLGDRAESFATEIVTMCCRRDTESGCLKLFLETCRPTWLKLRVAEKLLQTQYDDCIVPEDNRYLLSTPISLAKIVRYYFFLLPKFTKESNCSRVTTASSLKVRRKRGRPLQVIGDSNRLDLPEKRPEEPEINRRGETRLHRACIKNDVTLVKQLLHDGDDVNVTDYAGWTPLHEACNYGNTQCVKEILTARRVAIGSNQDTGFSKDEFVDLLAAPKNGTTPLHDAALNGHMGVAKLLVSAGGIRLLEAKQAKGYRPVDIAINEDMRQYLKEQMDFLQIQIYNTKNVTLTPEIITPSGNKPNLLRPTEEMYNNALHKKGTRKEAGVCAQQNEEYLLLLSHVLQAYIRTRQLPADCPIGDCGETTNVVNDDMFHWDCFRSHCDNLKSHIAKISVNTDLSSLSRVRLGAIYSLH